jgi:hypothetical protein
MNRNLFIKHKLYKKMIDTDISVCERFEADRLEADRLEFFVKNVNINLSNQNNNAKYGNEKRRVWKW